MNKKYYRLKLKHITLPVFLLSAQYSFAACNFINGYSVQDVVVAVPNFSVPRDVPVGTILTAYSPAPTIAYNGVNQNFASCTGTNGYYYQSSVATAQTVGGAANVYQTNIPGIGLRFYRQNDTGSKSYFTNNSVTPNGTDTSTNWNWNASSKRYWGAEVVVTGPIGSGTYAGTTDTGADLYGFAQLSSLLVTTIRVSPFTVTASSCQASNKTVNLGVHSVSEMPSLGSTTGQTDFSIDITGCPASGLSSIKYTLDNSNVVNPVNGVIGIDSFPGAAAGVGVKIMNNSGTPATFGTPVSVSYMAGSPTVSIPMKAALYRTVAPPTNITPGVVRASLKFTMTYQ